MSSCFRLPEVICRRVKPLAQKYFAGLVLQIRIISRAPVAHMEGRFANRHVTLGAGLRWTLLFSGRLNEGVRRSRVVLAPRCWRQVLGKLTLLRDDGGKQPVHRGERVISRKAVAQGMSVCSPLTCMLVCANVHFLGTRDRGCSAHPAPLRPLFRWRDNELAKLGQIMSRERETVSPSSQPLHARQHPHVTAHLLDRIPSNKAGGARPR